MVIEKKVVEEVLENLFQKLEHIVATAEKITDIGLQYMN